mgnify:FL=1
MNLIPLKLSVTTCYLVKIKTDEKFLLIDTGYEEDWDLFQRRLKEVNVELS